eukprot:147692-Rhodomonas_salina.2
MSSKGLGLGCTCSEPASEGSGGWPAWRGLTWTSNALPWPPLAWTGQRERSVCERESERAAGLGAFRAPPRAQRAQLTAHSTQHTARACHGHRTQKAHDHKALHGLDQHTLRPCPSAPLHVPTSRTHRTRSPAEGSWWSSGCCFSRNGILGTAGGAEVMGFGEIDVLGPLTGGGEGPVPGAGERGGEASRLSITAFPISCSAVAP